MLCSNFTLEGKDVKPELHVAFSLFVKGLEKEEMVELERRIKNNPLASSK